MKFKILSISWSPVDTVGAGNAYFAFPATFLAACASMKEVGFIDNTPGTLNVGIVGHRDPVDKISYLKWDTNLLK